MHHGLRKFPEEALHNVEVTVKPVGIKSLCSVG